jgi:hypothetical protein
MREKRNKQSPMICWTNESELCEVHT